MNNKQLLVTHFLFLTLLFVFSLNTFSQTPQYYNYNNVGASSNSFPFGQAAGKAVNWLFLAGDLNQPTPVPAGQQITKVWFFVTSGGTRTFTDLHVLMAQDTITTLTSAQFYNGPWDTVYYEASAPLTGITNGWMSITLEEPFPYDPTKSLLLFVGQCGGSGTGISIRQNALTDIRRVWSVGGCPFVPFAGGDGAIVNFGVDVVPAASLTPDYLFYKFENNPSPTTVINCADPGVGTQLATLTGLTLTPGGQFDSCITGTGAASAKVTTGYNWNMGSSSWTISMWTNIPSTNSGTAYYLFGDVGSGSFRCFHNGIAGQDSLVLRGTGITDVILGPLGSPKVVTFVYDSAAANIKGYINGVLVKTVNQTPLNMTTGTGFSVGGYSTSPSLIGKMDEFRLYKKALTAAEVASSWDDDIACGIIVSVNNNNNQIPDTYTLYQNYPNPFNPATDIKFAIPRSGDVEIKVFDMLGREVATIVNEFMVPGTYKIKFDASKLSSGVYIYKIKTVDFTDSKKMILIK